MINFTLLLIFYLIVLPTNAEAYLDPGTGSYIIQMSIGFLIGGVYVGKKYFRQLISFLNSLFKQKNRDGQKPKD